jgi:hypothetical protein
MIKKMLLWIAVILVGGCVSLHAEKKAAFLSMYSSIDAIEDDDEKAAATWFVNVYQGDFLPVSELPSINPDDYGVIWLHIDREDDNTQVPEVFLIPEVLEGVKAWYKNGGNLLLTTHASTYLTKLGRIDIETDVNGAGHGGDNGDVWLMPAVWGTDNPEWEVIDRTGDKIFEGLSSMKIQRNNGIEYDTYPLLGEGWKEDHNCFWSFNFSDDHLAKLRSFEQYYNTEGLSSWFFVTNYHNMGSARWHPTAEYQGTAITLGTAEYEWHENNGDNFCQDNVEKLTANALNELKNGKKMAYISAYNSLEEITDEEEKAAAQWFVNSNLGDFIPVYQLPATNVSEYGVLWIDADNDNGDAREALPAIFRLPEVLEGIKGWYKSGGNLLLTKLASQYLYDLGRIDFPANSINTGAGNEMNDDFRWLTASFGTDSRFPEVVDRSNDPIYEGLTTHQVERPDGNNYTVFPTIAKGWFKDHNCFWFGVPDEYPSKMRLFESYYNMQALSTWSFIGNYWGAAAARWFPTEEYNGTCITIGHSAYEWNQNSGENIAQGNIEKLTANALDELRDAGTGVKPVVSDNADVFFANNILRASGEAGKADLYAVSGVLMGKYNGKQLTTGVNIGHLPQGVYLVTLYDNQGKRIAVKKIVK